jgi:mRNA-degrading endonuclease RelE of RelBE toxin-antitoxin system
MMMISSQVMEQLEQLPESLQSQVLDYVKSLQQAHIEETKTTLELPIKKRRSGILKGTFVLPLPEDFDQPLEDFQEYM